MIDFTDEIVGFNNNFIGAINFFNKVSVFINKITFSLLKVSDSIFKTGDFNNIVAELKFGTIVENGSVINKPQRACYLLLRVDKPY